MNVKSCISRSAWRIVFVAGALALSACDAVNEAIDAVDDIDNDADVYYYVSLGRRGTKSHERTQNSGQRYQYAGTGRRLAIADCSMIFESSLTWSARRS